MRGFAFVTPQIVIKNTRNVGFQAALFRVFSLPVDVSSAFPLGCSEEPLSQNLGSEQISVNLDLLAKPQCPCLEVKGITL